MATSHSQVGIKFGQRKPANGSRMRSEVVGLNLNLGPHFTVVCKGISYSTPVATVVVNHHTQLSELWLSSLRYSSSTQQHKDHFREGFIAAYCKNHGCARDVASQQIFITQAVTDYMHTNRCDPQFAKRTLDFITQALPDVDKPRLRSATRMGTLMSCLDAVRTAKHRMTHGVPVDYPDAATLYELQDMEAFITHTMALFRQDMPETIDEVRAATRAWLTLNNPAHG